MLLLKEKLAKNYINARGWSTDQKLLLIESDDWGAIRMPSREVYDELLSQGIQVDKNSFDKHDALESSTDLESLFEVLNKFLDKNGNHPVITAYSVVANPNFDKIEKNGKTNYELESVLDTYLKYPQNGDVMSAIKKGIDAKIYIPQFHGREHIHVKRWMEAINSTSEKEQIAFSKRAVISSEFKNSKNIYPHDYFKGFDFYSDSEKSTIENIHREGLRMFKEIYQMPSLSFMAQGNVFEDHILKDLADMGVRLISGQQLVPNGFNNYKVVNKYWGATNVYQQVIWRRNCLFEPGRSQDFDWVNKCLKDIKIAFRWGKPAVISTHRQNFIGSIFEDNRVQSLEKLSRLLSSILKIWPDVKFVSTHDLANMMISEIYNKA